MTELIDFTNCKRIMGKAYNGANGKKIAIEFGGFPYMLKFPPSGADKPTVLSYTNSCISKHIASSIFNMLGVTAQETILGTFSIGGKSKIVCACRDFTSTTKRLYDFCSIKNTVIESDSTGNGTGMYLLLTHCWVILTGTTATGAFSSTKRQAQQISHQYMIVAVVYYPRQTKMS